MGAPAKKIDAPSPERIPALLPAWRRCGDSALEALIPLVYRELRLGD